jgi:hypothetical protein
MAAVKRKQKMIDAGEDQPLQIVNINANSYSHYGKQSGGSSKKNLKINYCKIQQLCGLREMRSVH